MIMSFTFLDRRAIRQHDRLRSNQANSCSVATVFSESQSSVLQNLVDRREQTFDSRAMKLDDRNVAQASACRM